MSLGRAAIAIALLLAAAGARGAAPPEPGPPRRARRRPAPRTFANPLNLDYRFALDAPGRREAADPVIVLFGDDYFLFASKSGRLLAIERSRRLDVHRARRGCPSRPTRRR